MDFHPILRAAMRSQAAYIEGAQASQAAFEALGYEWLGQYRNDDHQAVVTTDSTGAYYLSISGTRFATGKFGDLFEDLVLLPRRIAEGLGLGGSVTEGAYSGMDYLWSWAKSLAPLHATWTVDGHSLGAWRARYSPLFVDAAHLSYIYSFESPKGGDVPLWSALMPVLKDRLVSVVNGIDLFVSWPFPFPLHGFDWVHPPIDVIWLQDTGYQSIAPDKWPGGRRLSDHSIDLVVQRLATIVSASKAEALPAVA